MTNPRWIDRFSLDGKVALVTGGTSGIGYETCRVLADAGADIIASGTPQRRLNGVADAVAALGRRCHLAYADLSTSEGAVGLAREALAAFGRIDILVNNAGIAHVAPLLEATVSDWDEIMAVNLRAPFLIAREIAPQMIARRSGKIINISSQSGVTALEGHAAYCASKAGLNLLTKVMTVEWAKYNIQTNAICPTVILTPMGERVWGPPERSEPMLAKIPLGRFGKPVEVADAVLYLASGASDLVCGEVLMIDGGYTAI